MIITLFGASHPTDLEYKQAYELGRKIGKKGYTLKNGAYGGTMEASAKGCREEGGVVIGVGVEGHAIDRLGRPNSYNSEVEVKQNKNERIIEMLNTDLIIVLPGQIGTLEEMFMAWVEAIVGIKKPIIVVGEKMSLLIEYLKENNFIREQQLRFIKLAKDIDEIDF